MKWIIYIGMCILILLNVNAYSEIIYNYDNFDILDDNNLLSDPLSDNYVLDDNFEMPEVNILDTIKISKDIDVSIFESSYYINTETGEKEYGVGTNIICIQANPDVWENVVIIDNRDRLAMKQVRSPSSEYQTCYVIEGMSEREVQSFDIRIYGGSAIGYGRDEFEITIYTGEDSSLTLETDREYLGIKDDTEEEEEQLISLISLIYNEEGNINIVIIIIIMFAMPLGMLISFLLFFKSRRRGF